jgi:formyltetrahydrofolate deformylase
VRTYIDDGRSLRPDDVGPSSHCAARHQVGTEIRESGEVGRLTVSCADQPGIVAAITSFLYARGANIVQSDQDSSDPEGGRFLLRLVFRRDRLSENLERLRSEFAAQVAADFGMSFQLRNAAVPKRVAIFVSRYNHCLLDLLWRWRRGELPVDVGLVISNHPDLEDDVTAFGVPYVHIPVTKATKAEAEERQLALLQGNVDLVILARYMQVLSGEFLDRVSVPAINIHHSFLPAFSGAEPYRRAKDRGVKLIGATAHYVTRDLDEGPIIEQDVARVSHRDTAEELVRRGADIERVVLARAVKWHCEDRVLTNGHTTVVF